MWLQLLRRGNIDLHVALSDGVRVCAVLDGVPVYDNSGLLNQRNCLSNCCDGIVRRWTGYLLFLLVWLHGLACQAKAY